ncbi:MAG TPA: hypothetical protein VG675_07660 [Bryobacteraceae bacterium]|nr:hypothetical protein [Bryobacteraceae bacterium]
MPDIRVGKLTLKLSGLNRQESELLARRIADGLAASAPSTPPRKIRTLSSRITAPQDVEPNALAEAVVTDLIRSLKRGI